jgi:uncharacterized protein
LITTDVLLDANLLIYAVNADDAQHRAAKEWLSGVFDGDRRIALPWQTIGAFLRIVTHPRINRTPLSAIQAWDILQQWLDSPLVWVPPATERTAAIYRTLNRETPLTGNLVTDGQLAALAIEHGVPLYSADTDFHRFRGLDWRNPLR